MSKRYSDTDRFGGVFFSADQRAPYRDDKPAPDAYVTLCQPSVLTDEGAYQPAASVTLYVSNAAEALRIAEFFEMLSKGLDQATNQGAAHD